MPTSVKFYQGPGHTGAELMAIATNIGPQRPSENKKTADMVQVWIMPVSEKPTDAVKSGLDATVCGSCRFRPLIWKERVAALVARGDTAAAAADKPCYLYSRGTLARAANSVWRSHARGNIPYVEPAPLGAWLRALGKPVRWGAWGDPAFVPDDVRAEVDTPRGTSYTARWRECPSARFNSMASVSTVAEMRDAWSLGFRTYRQDTEKIGPQPGEFHCPEQARPELGITCSTCLACDGLRGNRRLSVMIDPI